MPKKLLNVEKNIKNNDIVVKTTQKEQYDENVIIETNLIEDEDENDSEQKEIIKKKAGRPAGSVKNYPIEQEYVILKMNLILGITRDGEIIDADEINDINNEKHKEILKCIPHVKKYFNVKRWSYFVCGCKKLSLFVKNLYTNYGYDVKQYSNIISGKSNHKLLIKKVKISENIEK